METFDIQREFLQRTFGILLICCFSFSYLWRKRGGNGNM